MTNGSIYSATSYLGAGTDLACVQWEHLPPLYIYIYIYIYILKRKFSLNIGDLNSNIVVNQMIPMYEKVEISEGMRESQHIRLRDKR